MTLITDRTLAVEPMLLRPFRVLDNRIETHDTFTVTFAPDDGGPGIPFAPGQFTMVYVYGIGEVPLSISGDPATPDVLVHTVRRVGAVTEAITSLAPGDVVGVRGPFGTAWPLDTADGGDVVVVAGGIGLAPVRPAVLHILDQRDRYGSVSIVYGSRTPADLLYDDQVHAWRARFDLNVQVTVDRGSDEWMGDVGVVTPMLNRVDFDPPTTTCIVCGPEIMMRVVAKNLANRGIPPEQVWVSLERNMKCGIGLCGHCQIGPLFVCKDGPVVTYASVASRLGVEEL
jgi:NAD(P)H-flavin reductase